MVAVAGDEGNKAQTVTREYTTVTVALDRVRAIADLGYRFTSWRVTGSDEVLSRAPARASWPPAPCGPPSQSFTATFRPITYKIVFQHYVDSDGQPVATGTMPASSPRPTTRAAGAALTTTMSTATTCSLAWATCSTWRTLDGKTVFERGG